MSERMSQVPHSYINYYSNWISEHGSIKLMWQGNLKRGKSFVILIDEPEPRKKDSRIKLSTYPNATTTTTTSTTSTATTTTMTTAPSLSPTIIVLENITASIIIQDNDSANLSFKSEPQYSGNFSSWMILGAVISVLALCLLVLLLALRKKPKTDKDRIGNSDKSQIEIDIYETQKCQNESWFFYLWMSWILWILNLTPFHL